MKTRAWIWQLNTDYPGANGDDTKLPIGEVWVKTHDGVSWMGMFYGHSAVPIDAKSVANLKRIYNDQGIDFVPWCVPKGTDPLREAQLANEVIAVTGSMVFDVEPYQHFWEGPKSNIRPYIRAIRAANPSANLTLSFDPRYGDAWGPFVDKLAEIGFDEWLPYMDSLAPQVYWDTFGVDPRWLLDHIWARLASTGKRIVWALPGDDPDPARFRRGFEYAVRLAAHQAPYKGMGGTSLWRRGVVPAANWETVSQTEIPTAEFEVDVLKAELVTMTAARDAALAAMVAANLTAAKRLKRIRSMETAATQASAIMEAAGNALRLGIPYVTLPGLE